MTLSERYTMYLESQGWKRDYTAPYSSKYIKYSHHRQAGWYFIGKKGGVRFSYLNKLKDSTNYTQRVKDATEDWERANGLTR
jgi:hypothetical protein